MLTGAVIRFNERPSINGIWLGTVGMLAPRPRASCSIVVALRRLVIGAYGARCTHQALSLRAGRGREHGGRSPLTQEQLCFGRFVLHA